MTEHLDYYDALQHLARAERISSRIHFNGQVSEPAEWFQSVDIFVSASYSEGQQVSLAEAMASGCYCLSHCWQGVEEMLPSENIYMTDVELRTKLLAYGALHEAEQHQAQDQMRALAEEQFDERRMVRETLAVVESVIGQ